jgi:hypothetical protein
MSGGFKEPAAISLCIFFTFDFCYSEAIVTEPGAGNDGIQPLVLKVERRHPLATARDSVTSAYRETFLHEQSSRHD